MIETNNLTPKQLREALLKIYDNMSQEQKEEFDVLFEQSFLEAIKEELYD